MTPIFVRVENEIVNLAQVEHVSVGRDGVVWLRCASGAGMGVAPPYGKALLTLLAQPIKSFGREQAWTYADLTPGPRPVGGPPYFPTNASKEGTGERP